MEQLQSFSNSTRCAAVLLDAWERGDLVSLKSHLDSTLRPQATGDLTGGLEYERLELVTGIAESMRDALFVHRGGTLAGCEMETSVQLLRHLCRLK